MKYTVTEDQYKALQKLADTKAMVDFMLEQSFGYHKVSVLLNEYNQGNVKVG